MNFKFQPYPGLGFHQVLAIRLGTSMVAVVPFACAADELRAEELMATWREEHYQANKQYYRDWDQYCSANSWWVSKVPVVG